jgi:putative DNA primase/helicase
VKAAQLSQLLGGTGLANTENWHACRCPVHGDTVFSLSLKDARHGRLLLRCFAGCPVPEVGAALKKLAASGLAPPPPPPSPTQEPANTSEFARKVWDPTVAIEGTIAEAYLRLRAITLSLPETLRFHSRLYHKDTGTWHPGLVAAVCNASGEQVAVHRTWLRADGTGKADVVPDKMSLGPVKGHSVHLGEGGNTLIIAEGIETALSIMQLYGAPAWATLSASNLPNVIIPDTYAEIIIAADHDPVGLAAAEKLRLRLTLQRRKVTILKPKNLNSDFNDVLMSRKETAA